MLRISYSDHFLAVVRPFVRPSVNTFKRLISEAADPIPLKSNCFYNGASLGRGNDIAKIVVVR